MKLRMLMVAVVVAALFLITGILYAANGDLIVNGNLGVGTSTPQGKAEVNGDMTVDGNSTVKGNTTTNGNTIVNGNLGVGTTTPSEKAEVNGNLKVNGNLCVGGNCTNSLQVSGGLYGWCQTGGYGGCSASKSPAFCGPSGYGTQICTCPTGYTLVVIGTTEMSGYPGTVLTGVTYYSCYKN